MRRAAQTGFSMIEILIAVSIVTIVIALGLPAYGTWIQNVQIRTASDAILNGLQIARNEAIRRNTAVQFQLVNGVNSQWAVNLSSDPGRAPPLFGRSAEEGSTNVTIVLTPGGADTVTFSALGRVVTNSDGSASITVIDVDNPLITVAADRRKLRIIVPSGGAIRMCDPQVAVTDPRTC